MCNIHLENPGVGDCQMCVCDNFVITECSAIAEHKHFRAKPNFEKFQQIRAKSLALPIEGGAFSVYSTLSLFLHGPQYVLSRSESGGIICRKASR